MTKYMRFRLKHGMFWNRSFPTPIDYKREVRLFVVGILLGITIWLAIHTNELIAMLSHSEVLKESYLKVVLGVMNGDARIEVAGHLFECKGGEL